MAEYIDTQERLRIAAECGNRLAMQIWNELLTKDESAGEAREKYWKTRLTADIREVSEVLDILEGEGG